MKDGKLNTQTNFKGWCSREAPLKPVKEKNEDGSYPAIITTEEPAMVVDWERFEMVREILLMDGVILPENKQVPLLDSHSRFSTSAVKGSIRNLRTEGKQLLGDVYFWSGAKEEESKVSEGHLTDLSAGYKTFEDKTIELRPGEVKEINGRVFENNFGDKLRLLIRLAWEEKEGSLVAIGADKVSKFKSELQTNPTLFDNKDKGIKSEDPQLQIKLDKAFEEIDNLKTKNEELNIKINERNSIMDPKDKSQDPNPDEIRKAERERVEGIKAVTEMLVVQKLYKGGAEELDKKVGEAINGDWTVGEFQKHCFDNLKDEDIVEKAVTDLDMSPKEVKRLSIKRAIDAMLELRIGNQNAWDDLKAGAEREAINETMKRTEKIPGLKLRGMPLPLDFFKNPDVMKHSNVLKAAVQNKMKNFDFDFGKDFGKRASDGISSSDATYLIGTQNMFNEFIDVLRNLGVAGPWGVRMISGANQNISVPKKTSTGTFHWVAESGTGTATDFVIGQLTATPKNGWASMKYTRQAALQSVPALDALIIDDILNNVIVGRDLALLHGTGASNQPTGIASTSGIGDVVGASLDWDAIVEFWTDVKTNNINSSNLRFVMNALTAGVLMKRPVVSGQTQMLFDRMGQLSAPPIVSEQTAANNLFYGDGSEAWMIDWSVIDLLVNPFKDDTGDVVITAFTAMDVLIARASAFSLADDVS